MLCDHGANNFNYKRCKNTTQKLIEIAPNQTNQTVNVDMPRISEAEVNIDS